ncbi:MAG: DUF2802 domain-containing protein [Gammaproteobacteria bacterium]|nr:DUF2802 domain-containing protein [Gammaproteobacteria bacterium]MDH5630361.1 DUF2802 domain-containing protein [Gammaproteobacteria bacterium]
MREWFIDLANNGYFLSLLTLLLVVGFFYVIKTRAMVRSLAQQVFQLTNDLRAINSGQIGMGKTIRHVSDKINHVQTNHQPAVVHRPIATDKAFEQAALLLSRGMSIEEVVEACGITTSEAELIAITRHIAPKHQPGKFRVA